MFFFINILNVDTFHFINMIINEVCVKNIQLFTQILLGNFYSTYHACCGKHCKISLTLSRDTTVIIISSVKQIRRRTKVSASNSTKLRKLYKCWYKYLSQISRNFVDRFKQLSVILIFTLQYTNFLLNTFAINITQILHLSINSKLNDTVTTQSR